MPHHLLDLPLLLQVIQCLPCQAAIDLQSVDECRDCDEAVGLDIFVEFIGGRFVEDNGVVCLILDWKREGMSVQRRQCNIARTSKVRGRKGCMW